MVFGDWSGALPKDGWCWLERKSDGQRRMACYDRISGWRVSDSIGRTVHMSESKVARLYSNGGRVVPVNDLEGVMIEDHGYYVPQPVAAELKRLRAALQRS